jgi:hypothetical protein
VRDRPNGADLLDVARVSLLEDVAPTLKGQQRYTVLMVANAMGTPHARLPRRSAHSAHGARCSSAFRAMVARPPTRRSGGSSD